MDTIATKMDGQVIIGIDADDSKAKEKLDDFAESTEGSALELAALEAGLVAASAALIKMAADATSAATTFEAAFAKTQTIMDATEVSVGDMEQSILSLSTSTGMAATDVSEAVYQAISGSVATADAVAFVDKANKLAVAGFTDLTKATDVLTTALNAYGLSAESVDGISNVLIKTQNLGKTSVDELSANMGKAIATGSAYGVNLENIATAYVELTKGGIATAESTTYISGMLNELGKEGSAVSDILKEQTGKSFGQLMADGATLGDVMQILSDSVNGDAEALMNLWGSQEAGKAANAIMTQSVADFNSVCAQMGDEMSGVASTTDDAYKTMTNTADFVNQRYTQAMTNLAIAYGDTLLPCVNGVKTALAGIAEGLTEMMNESPFVSSMITGLGVGIVAVTVSIAAYTAVTKLAESATIKLALSMATNPVVLAIGAVTALVAALVTLGSQADKERAKIDELTEASRNLADSISSAADSAQDSIIQMNLTASTASIYIDRLEELEAKSELSNAEQREWNGILAALVGTIPELSEIINTETGAIDGGTAAIRRNTDAWLDNQKQKIADEYLSEVNGAYMKALIEQEKNVNKEQELIAKRDNLKKQQDKLSADFADAQERHKLIRPNEKGQFDAEEVAAAREELESLATSLMNVDYQIESCEKDLKPYSEAVKTSRDAVSDAKDALIKEASAIDGAIGMNGELVEQVELQISSYEDATTAADNYAGAIDVVTAAEEVLTTATAESRQAFDDAYATWQEAYDTAFAAARSSIDGQIGLFGDMSEAVKAAAGVTEKSAKEAGDGFIAALDSELAYMDTYKANMQKASELGINEGLLKILSDGSTEHSQILAEMVNMSADQIAEMNEKYANVEEGKDDFSDAMVEYTGVVEDETDAMIQAATEAGIDMADELRAGLEQGLPAFRLAWKAYTSGISPGAVGGGGGAVTAAYASGTEYATRGLALVGEKGPELVYFRGGEKVLNADQTSAALRSVRAVAPDMAYTGAVAPSIAGKRTIQLTATLNSTVDLDGREVAKGIAAYVGEEQAFEVM